MNVEERQTCQDCGKQIQKFKGSITQWIGLGDYCKCEHASTEADGSVKKPKGQICRRCKLPISGNQSLTQWLIRKETCKCAEKEATTATDYAQKAVSKHAVRKYRQGKEESKYVTVFIVVVFILLLFLIPVCSIYLCEKLELTRFGIEKGKPAKIFVSLYKRNSYIGHAALPEKKADWNSADFLSSDELVFRHITFSNEDLRNIGENSQANKICLEQCDGYTEGGIYYLLENRCLTSLSLEGSKVDIHIMQALEQGHLETINLSRTSAEGDNIIRLAKKPELKCLILTGINLNESQTEVFTTSGFQWSANRFIRSYPLRTGKQSF